ncbi:MAG: hypothetical protein HY698_07765 [Deltaproteobacteria bacterium]|nr:hypothetical protein [Deltaproteobacteria bacterium]
MKNVLKALLAGVLFTTTLAGCGDDGNPAITGQPDGGSADAGATTNKLPDFEGGVEAFKTTHALTQAYWYSRYNLGALVMKAGLGETFMPGEGMPEAMAKMVSDDKSQVMLPSNPALLKRVFNRGNPSFTAAHDDKPMDFADERWVGGQSVPTTGAAFGWTMVKELEWAKQFHVDAHFGIPGKNDIPGANERFAGLVLYAEAVMQAMELMQAPEKFNLGSSEDAHVALMAIADLAQVTGAETMPHSASNRYKQIAMGMAPDKDLAKAFLDQADMLYGSLPSPKNTRERATAIQALAFYGAASATNRAAVKAKISDYAEALTTTSAIGTLDRAAIILGLTSAIRAVGAKDSWTASVKSTFNAFIADYDGKAGLFKDLDEYTPDTVAAVLRALNGATLWAKVDNETAFHVLTDLFESVMDVGGLQISAPPLDEIPEYERLPSASNADALFIRYPTLPTPPKAGGAYGIAPVSAAKATYSRATKKWTTEKTNYDTAGAMRLANECIWLHSDEVDGFPQVP